MRNVVGFHNFYPMSIGTVDKYMILLTENKQATPEVCILKKYMMDYVRLHDPTIMPSILIN